jgi:hypothetical protein
MPTMSSSLPRTAAARRSSSLISPNGVVSVSPLTPAGRKFIGGEPMNPATKRLTGCSYSSRGEATCWIFPFRSTQTRSPSVIASVWSWVT